MKIFRIYAAAAGISGIFLPFPYTLAAGEAPSVEKTESGVCFAGAGDIRLDDPFWGPKFRVWDEVTVTDVLDKFSGLHTGDPGANDAFANFDKVASGHRGTKDHFGEPWFDGLVYETVRGAADYLVLFPDEDLESRLDGIISRIAAAQDAVAVSDPGKAGYLETYTLLDEPGHEWGLNGGFLRWQHEVYNAGMLIEAGVHYYKATGKTALLETAVRFANLMCRVMGESPKMNIVPSHSGPEEAMVKLYRLFRDEPGLKGKLPVPVDADAYLELAEFWIENRGNSCGYPLWKTWGNTESERWIRDCGYEALGKGARPGWGDYAQDSVSVFDACTMEGHAVRATLLATGIAAAANENASEKYMSAASTLWDNMAGRRMFITGGVGAVHEDEKFGPDWYLPTGAYLETCAAVGAGFFSGEMNRLTADAKYMDVLERVLYNSLLAGVSLSGDMYTYQNPLNADNAGRWEWHSCPCCPPMFLKMTSSIPGYIYAYDGNSIYVNLFIGSTVSLPVSGGNEVTLRQVTRYPWSGTVEIAVSPERPGRFPVKVRIPGWAVGAENPYGLYMSDREMSVDMYVNGEPVSVDTEDGYACVLRKWKKGDVIRLELPVAPRVVSADGRVTDLSGKVALAAGPLVYCFEKCDNGSLEKIRLEKGQEFDVKYEPGLLGGINVIESDGMLAVPYYAVANRSSVSSYRVWVSAADRSVKPVSVDTSAIEGRITPYLYGACIEDVNHEIYGGIYGQRIFGESFEEPAPSPDITGFSSYEGEWIPYGDSVEVYAHPGAKLVYDLKPVSDGKAGVDIRFTGVHGDNAGLLVRVSAPGNGADSFYGYEISLASDGRKVVIGKHENNFTHLADVPVSCDPRKWNRLEAGFRGGALTIFLNGEDIYCLEDNDPDLREGKVALRTWNMNVMFRNLSVVDDASGACAPAFEGRPSVDVSRQWRAFATGDAAAEFRIDTSGAFNGRNAQVMRFASGEGKAGISNSGLNGWGIHVRKGRRMEGSVWLRNEGKGASVLKVALASRDRTAEYASEEIAVSGKEWKKYRFSLVPDTSDTCACFIMYMDSPGEVAADQAVLLDAMEDRFRGLPLRNDVASAMVDQGLTFLRYGGTMVNAPEYRFKNMIGDPDFRSPYHGHWYRYSTNGFGIEDFLKFCEAAGFTPAFAINIEESPEDMADMVEYLNGPVSSEWGKKRAENGHPEPYGVRYIGIGNEEVLFHGDRADEYDHYIERFLLLHDAMKSKDPSLELVCTAWWRPESPNVERVFRALDGKASYWDYHPWADGLDSGEKVFAGLKEMRDCFRRWNPDTWMKCAIFEENGNLHNMQRALGHVALQNAVRRMGDFVLTSCAANALQPYGQNDNGWDQGQVFFTPSRVWGMPPYHAQKMASENHLPLLVKGNVANADGVSCRHLDMTATRSVSGDTLVLHIANLSPFPENVRLDIPLPDSPDRISAWCISGELGEENTVSDPRRISPEALDVYMSAGMCGIGLPAYSYTLVRVAY